MKNKWLDTHKFFQIAANEKYLFALDNDGRIWQYSTIAQKWYDIENPETTTSELCCFCQAEKLEKFK